MSGNYVAVEMRPHPAIGYDPCPGSVDGSIGLADQMRGFHEHTGELAAFLEGARHDVAHWAGENQRAFQEAMVELPPKLHQISDAFQTAQQAVRDWAGELADLQVRSLQLDERLAGAIEALEASQQAVDSWVDTGDNRHEWNLLSLEHGEKQQAERDARAAVGALEGEYRERAEHYGRLINAAGDNVWSSSWWDTIKSHIDDLGDWLEDSFLGDITRWLAPVADWVAEWGGWIAAGALVLGGISLFVFPPAAPFLFGAAGIAGAFSTAAEASLAVSGYGDWGFVPLALVTFGIGKGVGHAGRRILAIRNQHGAQNVRVQTQHGQYEYVPSMFTADEFYGNEIIWRTVKLKGNQAEWAITGYGLSQSFTGPGDPQPVPQSYSGYEDVDPWDLPPGAAYLEDRDGELVR